MTVSMTPHEQQGTALQTCPPDSTACRRRRRLGPGYWWHDDRVALVYARKSPAAGRQLPIWRGMAGPVRRLTLTDKPDGSALRTSLPAPISNPVGGGPKASGAGLFSSVGVVERQRDSFQRYSTVPLPGRIPLPRSTATMPRRWCRCGGSACGAGARAADNIIGARFTGRPLCMRLGRPLWSPASDLADFAPAHLRARHFQVDKTVVSGDGL